MGDMRVIPARPAWPQRLRVAAYARVSTEHERQLSSIAAQVSYYSHLIQSTPGWDYVGVFIDEGITGTSTKHRDGFKHLMDTARAGGIDVILTKSISRLARNTVDLLATVRELKALGVAVRFEREQIDTATADGELLLTLLASFAQEESRSLSHNVKWAIRNRYKNGGTNSFVVYGYHWADGKFAIIDEEAEIVRLLFSNFLKGISPEKTAAILNEQGVRSRGGGRFYGSVFRRMLENERYKGCQMLQKMYRPTIQAPTRCLNDGELPRYWVDQALPPIIDEVMFDAVQAEIAYRREAGPAATPSKNTGVFTGRIYCRACGKNYQRKTRTYKSGTSYKFWRCWSACTGNGNPCSGHNLRETLIERACADVLGTQSFDPVSVAEQIVMIEAFPHQLTFHLTDGTMTPVGLTSEGRLA
ncbi:recombinase family protein [Corynebacterium diphtheriae bv. mitis]|nr:recombinase family protein [Corynebacterium diphtheriae bv. mitis]CAB0674243.1 recombinase family protein [Corynebacterium diphtheriae]CAB0714362.1 recombinase family protein [Corynebacterium diphtheriae]CAB0740971.1 recombinase family protein [Corynebacterium diphtheriae]CAB0761861.1 recombinase family protein [Corynebacterium diphtheriae]